MSWLLKTIFIFNIHAYVQHEIPISVKGENPREKKLLSCKSCHQEVFENWRQGPHANAWVAKENFKHRIREFPETHHPIVSKVMEKDFKIRDCDSCHASANQYEHFLKDANNETNLDDFFSNWTYKKGAVKRPINESLKTGVDCLTCHTQGNHVLTNYDSKADPNAPCKPLPSKAFSSVYNCYSCHFSNVTSQLALSKTHPKIKNMDCVKCHQEYKAPGIGTHYFYWPRDPKQKKRPQVLGGLFESVKVASIKKENGKMKYKIEINNKSMPHDWGFAPEIVMDVEFRGAKNQIFKTKTFRINSRNFYEQNKFGKDPLFKGKKVPGVPGDRFKYREANNETYSFAPGEVDRVVLKGYRKWRHWDDDDTKYQLYEKVLAKSDRVLNQAPSKSLSRR